MNDTDILDLQLTARQVRCLCPLLYALSEAKHFQATASLYVDTAEDFMDLEDDATMLEAMALYLETKLLQGPRNIKCIK